MKIALLLAVLAVPALAADSPSAKLIRDIEGVYQARADEVIEVVRHDDSHVYLHAAIFSPDGRHCNIAGIAAFEKGNFVFRDPSPGLSDVQCTLTLSVKDGALRLTDRATATAPPTCKELCGARGSLGDYAVATSVRAKITYLPKLKASREYLKAAKEFAESQR
ncbi:MAG: hypothetical protein V4484_16650 [Pseudomonadota bacterium]